LRIYGQTCGYGHRLIWKPASFNDGIASGGGTSIQSTCPERSAARRVVASGIGIKTIFASLGMRWLSQYPSWRLISTYWPDTTLVILNGPVPAGDLPNSLQLRPVLSHCVGLTMSIVGTMYGKKLNGALV
jgi:hypothetical protein